MDFSKIKPGTIIPLSERGKEWSEKDFIVVWGTKPLEKNYIYDDQFFPWNRTELKPYGFRPKEKFQDVGDPVLYPVS